MSELKEVIQELNEVSVYLAEIGSPVKANKVNNAVAELRKYSELTKRVEAFAKWVPNSRPVDPKIKKVARDPDLSIEVETALDFANWINNNFLIPAEHGDWRLLKEHPEYTNPFEVEYTVNLFTTEQLYESFYEGEGAS